MSKGSSVRKPGQKIKKKKKITPPKQVPYTWSWQEILDMQVPTPPKGREPLIVHKEVKTPAKGKKAQQKVIETIKSIPDIKIPAQPSPWKPSGEAVNVPNPGTKAPNVIPRKTSPSSSLRLGKVGEVPKDPYKKAKEKDQEVNYQKWLAATRSAITGAVNQFKTTYKEDIEAYDRIGGIPGIIKEGKARLHKKAKEIEFENKRSAREEAFYKAAPKGSEKPVISIQALRQNINKIFPKVSRTNEKVTGNTEVVPDAPIATNNVIKIIKAPVKKAPPPINAKDAGKNGSPKLKNPELFKSSNAVGKKEKRLVGGRSPTGAEYKDQIVRGTETRRLPEEKSRIDTTKLPDVKPKYEGEKADWLSQSLSNLFGVKVTPGHQIMDPEGGGITMATSPHAKYNPKINPIKAMEEDKKRKKLGYSKTAFPQ